jgi:hypothetical protein
MNEGAVHRAMFMALLWLLRAITRLLFVERRGRIEMSSAAAAISVQGEDEVAACMEGRTVGRSAIKGEEEGAR